MAYLEMLDDELQNVEELRTSVAVLDDDLLGPVREHGVSVLHPARHGRREDLEGLPPLHSISYFPSLAS